MLLFVVHKLLNDNTIIKESMPCHVSQWHWHSGTALMSRLARARCLMRGCQLHPSPATVQLPQPHLLVLKFT